MQDMPLPAAAPVTATPVQEFIRARSSSRFYLLKNAKKLPCRSRFPAKAIVPRRIFCINCSVPELLQHIKMNRLTA
jgi:hypothetical protein